MRQRCFILSRLQIQYIRTNGLEFVELGVENLEVQVVPKIDPGTNEETKIWDYKRMVQIIQNFRRL